jgi:hypothetical protein
MALAELPQSTLTRTIHHSTKPGTAKLKASPRAQAQTWSQGGQVSKKEAVSNHYHSLAQSNPAHNPKIMFSLKGSRQWRRGQMGRPFLPLRQPLLDQGGKYRGGRTGDSAYSWGLIGFWGCCAAEQPPRVGRWSDKSVRRGKFGRTVERGQGKRICFVLLAVPTLELRASHLPEWLSTLETLC